MALSGRFALLLALAAAAEAALVPNALLSAGKTAYGSSLAYAPALTDGNIDNPAGNMAADSWVALKLESSAEEVLVLWSGTGGNWSDSIPSVQRYRQNLGFPSAYEILTSSNSTNGVDGDWTQQVAITGNVVIERGHRIPFAGASWVKIHFTAGSFGLAEVQVFDVSQGGKDSWFMLGTSITAMSEKYTDNNTVASLAHGLDSTRTPAIVRGGVGGVNSTEVLNSLSAYLDHAAPMSFWAIEMGTNDGSDGGILGLATFKANMQAIIDSARQRGVEPVLARSPATNPSVIGWQLDTAYVVAIDELQEKNKLAPGPDLYSYFLAHPEKLDGDGLHPSKDGGLAIRKLWAQAMVDAQKFEFASDSPMATRTPRKMEYRPSMEKKSFDLLGRKAP